MPNNNDSSDSKAKKFTFCEHLMPNFDTHKYCFKCREAGKGKDLVCYRKIVCVWHSPKIKKES